MQSIDTAPEDALDPPRSLTDLFISFNWLALQGFGGVVAVAQRVLVEQKRWMTREEFIEEWAVAQVLPGPNVVNLALMIGDRHFGLRGAIVSLLGLMVVPLGIVLALTLIYAHYSSMPQVSGALRGMGAVAAGMVAGTGVKLLVSLRTHPLGLPMCLALAGACFVAIGLLRLPLVLILLVLGTLACTLTWRKLAE